MMLMSRGLKITTSAVLLQINVLPAEIQTAFKQHIPGAFALYPGPAVGFPAACEHHGDIYLIADRGSFLPARILKQIKPQLDQRDVCTVVLKLLQTFCAVLTCQCHAKHVMSP